MSATAVESPADSPVEFITGNHALSILKSGWYKLQRAAIAGDVRVDCRPGRPIAYCKADVLKLAQERRVEARSAGA
jgi:hypothetical protein